MKKIFSGVLIASLAFILTVSVVYANHSWNGYHWARTANPFTLKLGDNLSASWEPFLSATSADWSVSTVLDTIIVAGQGKANCRATAGRVEVCNKTYGNNGWLGIAQIWVNGTHITQGVTKMNDTYFNTATYNTPAWKNLVMCQEIGHTFGLNHQDEIFNNTNLGTCMDYTNDPDGTIYKQLDNTHPNAHDYEELGIIYSHLDSISTVDQTTGQIAKQRAQELSAENMENPGEWGKSVKDNGRVALFERDLGAGNKIFTFVVWAAK